MTRRCGTRSAWHGFTLVELLAVVGIVGLLTAILLPSLGRARQQANLVACAANLRTVGQALSMYANDNRGSLPISNYVYPNGDAASWHLSINKYVGNKKLDSISPILTDRDTLSSQYEAWWYDSVNLLTYSAHGSYFNYAPNDPTVRPYKLTRFKRQTERVIIWDAPQYGNLWGDDKAGLNQSLETVWMLGDTETWAMGWLPWPLPDWYTASRPAPDPGVNTDPWNRYEPFPGATDQNQARGQFRFRHMKNTQANFLFVDGHVAPFTRKRSGYGGSDLRWENVWWVGMD